jgi:hypothetical protein
MCEYADVQMRIDVRMCKYADVQMKIDVRMCEYADVQMLYCEHLFFIRTSVIRTSAHLKSAH